MTNNHDKEIVKENDLGEINISDEVIEIITNISAKEVEGVKGLYGNISDDIAGIFTRKSHNKGVSIQIIEEKVNIELNIIVEFGVKIPEVAWQVQENVKNAVESMTGIEVEVINVNIAGINFTK